MTHVLLDHLKNCKKYLLAHSEAIAIAEHKVNLGSAREALIANFLEKNLPTAINYCTGELFDMHGKKSGQIDIILTPSTAPKLNLFSDYNLIASDTALGVIEVKSILNTGNEENGSVAGALKNCYKVKALNKVNDGELELSKGSLDLRTVPYVIFAFSGGSKEVVLDNIDRHMNKHSNSFKDIPDIIVVLDAGYCLTKKKSWMLTGNNEARDVYRVTESDDYALLGLYDYILSVSEHLSTSPADFKMPLREYTEKMTTLFDSSLFDWG
ncbi:DUF6602 domain-containing protein [Aliivibrio logei]|uniref:DUF6602 domain-containing protein n=1 Tax=Aliivibrio logei TaxID=688 RepID=UPI00039DABB4|nr:DUF6602 domain-containing protein [Aliivibrio logei]